MLKVYASHHRYRHCPFLRTDYSMPVSSCPPRGLSLLSCNDVISLDRQGSEKLYSKEILFRVE